jgi:serine/tyrosine/threonine adenylyltransferase
LSPVHRVGLRRKWPIGCDAVAEGIERKRRQKGMRRVVADTNTVDLAFGFDHSYGRLPERFYARLGPTRVSAPELVWLNEPLAVELGLDVAALKGGIGAQVFGGNGLPRDADPLAMAYAGHQFGGFVPQLGDGRALLLGEVIARDGARFDIQLKGAGPTPFSRRGDGRAGLGPVLRECVMSEAMAALGVPTTRSLAAVVTGEMVAREQLVPGAVLTRVAASHIRVGTFQYFATRGDVDGLRVLVDHVIARHDPEAANAPNPALAMLEGVIARQADLIARWLLIGFIHGVMNTDNASIAGETIDYGPCAFLDAYHPAQVFSSIDQRGRYAFGNQPQIAQWNMARLAEAVLPLLAEDEDAALELAKGVLAVFPPRFEAAYVAGMAAKIGLADRVDLGGPLAIELLGVMARNRADFTVTFRGLCEVVVDEGAQARVRAMFEDGAQFDVWATAWRAALGQAGGGAVERRAAMLAVNPAYIPRNHQVEAVIAAAVSRGDFAPFYTLMGVLARPFAEQVGMERFALAPLADEVVTQTFCGT